MTITLPDALKEDLERRARAFGYESVDEYVTSLVEEDADPETAWVPTPEQLGFASMEALENHLIASLNSGPGVVVDEAYWADLRRRVDEAVAARAEEPT